MTSRLISMNWEIIGSLCIQLLKDCDFFLSRRLMFWPGQTYFTKHTLRFRIKTSATPFWQMPWSSQLNPATHSKCSCSSKNCHITSSLCSRPWLLIAQGYYHTHFYSGPLNCNISCFWIQSAFFIFHSCTPHFGILNSLKMILCICISIVLFYHGNIFSSFDITGFRETLIYVT